MTRLDDPALIRRLELQTLALERLTTAECAAFMRAGFTAPTAINLEVATTLIGAFETDELVEWYRLTADAMRAELRGSPPKRTVSAAEFDQAFASIAATWTDDEAALVQTVSLAPTKTSDADMCTFVDLVYGRLDRLSDDDLAVVALYDINPAP